MCDAACGVALFLAARNVQHPPESIEATGLSTPPFGEGGEGDEGDEGGGLHHLGDVDVDVGVRREIAANER